MSTQSPFADFYDSVFVLATREEQDSFLRQLFTIDGSLCASFEAYINPPLSDVEVELEFITPVIMQMREQTKKYDWSKLFDMNPLAEDYTTELIDVLTQKFIRNYILKMEAYCRTGDLLSALSCLRIIEQGTNVNWEKVEEPASHHVNEVKEHIGDHFNFFTTHFFDNIFSIELIKKAVSHIEFYHSEQEGYFDYSEYWMELLDLFNDRLAGKI